MNHWGAPTGHGIPARGETPGIGCGYGWRSEGTPHRWPRVGGRCSGGQLQRLGAAGLAGAAGAWGTAGAAGAQGVESSDLAGSTIGSRAWISRIRTLKFHEMSEPNPLSNWTPEQIRLGKQWVRSWAETGAIMDQLRREALRKTDTVESLQRLAGAFESARHMGRPRLSSGLVAQQAFFLKCRPALHG